MLHTTAAIAGYRLASLDGELGSVREFYFDDRSWTIRYLVADTGGLWLTGITVLIAPESLVSVNEAERNVSVAMTQEQIERSPVLSSQEPLSAQFEEVPFGVYGSIVLGVVEPDGSVITPGKGHDPHLRSTDHVRGYHLKAADGEIGHVDDFIIDDESWMIRYLVIATHNWLPGKKVLISPQWIERVTWRTSKVVVGVTRETVAQAPEYTGASMPTREHEIALHRHYDRPGYWVEPEAAKHGAGGRIDKRGRI